MADSGNRFRSYYRSEAIIADGYPNLSLPEWVTASLVFATPARGRELAKADCRTDPRRLQLADNSSGIDCSYRLLRDLGNRPGISSQPSDAADRDKLSRVLDLETINTVDQVVSAVFAGDVLLFDRDAEY